MNRFVKVLLMILMYLLLFVGAFGMISFFTQVKVLPELNYQLYGGVAAIVLAIIVMIFLFKDAAREDAEELQQSNNTQAKKEDIEIDELAMPTERNYDDNEEYIDETTLLDTNAVLDTLAGKVIEESLEATKKFDAVEDTAEEDIIEDEIVDEQPIEKVMDRCPAEEEEVEIVDESDEQTLSSSQQITEELLSEEKSGYDKALETIETAEKDSEIELTPRTGARIVEAIMSEIHETLAPTEDAGDEIAYAEEPEIAEDYQPIIDDFKNAVENLAASESIKVVSLDEETTIEEESEKAEPQKQLENTSQFIVEDNEGRVISPDLSETQVVYIDKSLNSYINTEGLPQLVVTGEVNAEDVQVYDEEIKKIAQEQEKKIAELKKAEEEAEIAEHEEKQEKIARVFITIFVILLLGCIGVGAYYAISRGLI